LRPDLPTVADAGVPGFSTTAWFGLFGPANLAPELVAKIHADVGKVLDSPQARDFFAKNSFERVDRTPAQFAQLIQDDLKHWGALIKALGVKLD
jgi:tripartite-type tricarboxylate transporter receptor subunit TctC